MGYLITANPKVRKTTKKGSKTTNSANKAKNLKMMHEIRTKSLSYPKIHFLKKTMQIVVSLLPFWDD